MTLTLDEIILSIRMALEHPGGGWTPVEDGHLAALCDAAAKAKNLRAALYGLVDALAANNEDGLTEFAEPMTAARAPAERRRAVIGARS